MSTYRLKVLFSLIFSTSCICSQSVLHALVIKNRGVQNWRVWDPAQGPSRTAPVNPLFIGASYDLSGLSVFANVGNANFPGGAMMISPHHFVTATHYNGASSFIFINRDGAKITKFTESGRAMVRIMSNGSFNRSDLFIGRLAGDGITAADKITCYPVMMESESQNWNWYLNKQILVCGGGSLEAGFNTITQVTDSGVLGLIGKSIFFNYSGAYTNQAGLIGESGSPWGLLWNGNFYAGGAHSGIFGTASENANYTSLSSFVPAFADQIDAYIAETHPAEKITRHTITNTKPRIIGANHLTFLPGETAKSPNLQILDETTPTSGITLAATSSDQAVLPNSSLSYSGSGNTGNLIVTPPTGASGIVTVTLTASDGSFTASKNFTVTIISSAAGLPTTLQGGSFETPVVSGLSGGFQYAPTGSGWSFNGQSVIQSNGSVWQGGGAPDGIQTAALQGVVGGLGTISQALNLSAGSYILRFDAARRTNQSQLVRFSVDDNQIGALIEPKSNNFDTYTLQPFTVTAGVHNLRFEVVNSYGDNSTFIDLVEMVRAEAGFPSYITPAILGYSFETPEVSEVPGRYVSIPSGSGWRFTGGSGILANGNAYGAFNAPDGVQAALLQGGAVSQVITFTAGTYHLSYFAARRDSQIQPIKISVNGTQLGPLFTPATAIFNKYTTPSFTVAAGSYTVRLEATNTVDDRTSFIDRVEIKGLEPSISDIIIPSTVIDAQPLKMLSGGTQRGVEYLRPTLDSARSVPESSINLINWLPVSEVPSLSTSLTLVEIGTEKVTIQVQDAAAQRFFRLRDLR